VPVQSISPAALLNATLVAGAVLTRLRREFSSLKGIPGLELEFSLPGKPPEGLYHAATHSPSGRSPAAIFRVDEKSRSELIVYCRENSWTTLELLKTTIGSVLKMMAVEQREEMLLDELGSNWESLEAIYEISSDVLRYTDVEQALERLVDRFISLQDGLRAALFLTRGGQLQAVAGQQPSVLEWSSLGRFENSIRGNRSILINDAPEDLDPAGLAPWSGAPRVAAAPVTSRQRVIGLLVVWREDTLFEFGAPFSRLLEAITYQASMLLESDRLSRTMRENERWAQEIEIASSIQQSLLFGKPPVNIPGLDISSCSAPSQLIDGDFHDFLAHSRQCVDVLIGDVMGKGIAAALLGAATKNQFLRAITNLAIRSQSGPPSPAAIVNRAAGRIGDQLMVLERFVTLCYARFDLERNCLEYVDCGHTGIILNRKQTGESTILRGDDLPLGVLPNLQCSLHSHAMMPGDTYLLFSDGVTETRSRAGEFFGEERLTECVRNWSSLGATILLEQIRKAVTEFSDHAPQTDDFTCIAVAVRLDTSGVPLARRNEEFRCSLDELGRMRDWIGESAGYVSAEGLDPVSLPQLELACTELFVNCVAYGASSDAGNSGGSCAESISMTALAYPTCLTVELRHKGIPFDPLAVSPPSFDGSKDGGFGTYVVLNFADEVCYSRTGDTNIISISVMLKNRP
jgi:sigma-B regulation protein RsbU (phosphoserine phosphatase)